MAIQWNDETVRNFFGLPVDVAKKSRVSTEDDIPSASVKEGTLRVDTANDDLYFYSNGAWHKVANTTVDTGAEDYVTTFLMMGG